MGMNLDMGLGGQGGFQYTYPGTQGTNANASPQGPATAAAAGFGTTVGSKNVDGRVTGFLSVGTLSLAALILIWWSLPR